MYLNLPCNSINNLFMDCFHTVYTPYYSFHIIFIEKLNKFRDFYDLNELSTSYPTEISKVCFFICIDILKIDTFLSNSDVMKKKIDLRGKNNSSITGQVF